MTQSKKTNTGGYVLSISIIGALFFIFGFVTWLNGTLIPFLQTACELSPVEASLVTMAFYIAYFVMALPSSFVLKKTGYKNGMSLGLLVMSAGALLFIPAAYSRMFGIFLTGLFVMGTGLALLQTAVNPYITIIGPRESAAARISIMGICNKLAGFISPLILTALVMHGMEKFKPEVLNGLDQGAKSDALNELASRLVGPYMVIAIVLVLLALMIKLSPLPDTMGEDEKDETLLNYIRQIPNAIKIPHLVLGMLALFLYVGVEVMAGDSISQFGQHLNLVYASKLTSFTMAFMVLGYIAGIIAIPKYISQSTALRVSAVLGAIFAMGAIFSSPESNSLFTNMFGWLNSISVFEIPLLPDPVFFIALLGLANALMWPAIWPLVLQDLGKYTKIASALLIMGIAGGALIPPAYIRLSMAIGYQQALWIMVPVYLFILYYSVYGYKIRRT
ncbi:MAG: sugar MFS transporter [Bacteroidales bacterium]